MSIYIFIHMSIHIYAQIYAHASTHICAHAHASTNVYTHTCLCPCLCTCLCACHGTPGRVRLWRIEARGRSRVAKGIRESWRSGQKRHGTRVNRCLRSRTSRHRSLRRCCPCPAWLAHAQASMPVYTPWFYAHVCARLSASVWWRRRQMRKRP